MRAPCEKIVGIHCGMYGYWFTDLSTGQATACVFVPDELPGEDPDARTARISATSDRLKHPDVRKVDVVLAMRAWLDVRTGDGKRPGRDLSVYCHAQNHRGKRCRKRIASVWSTPRGYYLTDAQMRNFHEARVSKMELAMTLRQFDEPITDAAADMAEMAADDKAWPSSPIEMNLSDPPSFAWAIIPDAPMAAFGCPHHGNVAVPVALLRDMAASPTRRHLNLDPQESRVYGYTGA